jgi:pimeloyl-ACP methyl ester carboxylesterase
MMSTSVEHVLLLHGLGRDASIMGKMALALQRQGYHPHRLSYPSLKLSIPQLARFIQEEWQSLQAAFPGVWHFVGHSMGAIILRQIMAWHPELLQAKSRVLMLGPPNHGTEVVDFFSRYQWFLKIYGPAALDLRTGPSNYLSQLPQRFDYASLGVIAGNRSIDYLYSWFLLPGENDGKVTVSSTRLAGCDDHLVLPVPHPQLPENPLVIDHCLHFLSRAEFSLPSIT